MPSLSLVGNTDIFPRESMEITMRLSPELSQITQWLEGEVRERLDRTGKATVKRVGAAVLAEARRAFALQRQTGGYPWDENREDLKAFKMIELEQNPVQVGIINGALMRSISLEYDNDGTRAYVGSPLNYALDFSQGGPFPEYFLKSPRTKRWHRFKPGEAPPRPFLPTLDWVSQFMQEVFFEQWAVEGGFEV